MNTPHTWLIAVSMVWSSLLPKISRGQQACPIANATNLAVCANDKVFAGTQTDIGYSYTWYRNADLVEGPLSGNGGSISFGFDVYAPAQAGQYTIERQGGSGGPTCAFNVNVILIPLPVVQDIAGAEVLCGTQNTLQLASSQLNTGYQLIRNGNINVGSVVQGTGNPLLLGNVTLPGIYSVRAQKTNCFGNSFIVFGNKELTVTPALTVNYTTASSANISWGGTGAYIIEYGPAGFAPGTGSAPGINGTVLNVTGSNYTIGGLTAGIRYTAYVRQSCGQGNYTANSTGAAFSTDCPTISSFPYSEGFESGTATVLPVCIKALDYDQDAGTGAGIQSSGYRSGTKCGTLNGEDLMVLPRMNLSGNKRLRYFAKAIGNMGVCTVWMSTSTNAVSSFSNLLLADTVTPGGYLEKTVDLSGYSGNVYLAFRGSAGTSVLIDDILVENIPACPGPAFITPGVSTSNGLFVSWQGTGNYILEYGLAGFTPGTGSVAGLGGTLINNAVSPARISGLSPATSYDIYIRQSCGGFSYSSNSTRLTVNTFLSCTSAATITECVNSTANFTAGTGLVNFEGSYPYRSTGFLAPGKELLYQFTPSATGVYFIETAAGAGSAVHYYYKTGTCNDQDWIPVGRGLFSFKMAVGMLTAGVTYYILLDRESTNAGAQTFKICRAGVGAPPAFNRCIGTLPLNNKIPAFSPKEEYVIDSTGNVIASLNFINCSTAPGNITVSYYVNSGAVRRDSYNREYLNRSLTVNAAAAISGAVKIKMFFTDAELQALINEPDDGVADLSDAGGLNATLSPQNCAAAALPPSTGFLPQQSHAVYNTAAGYISFISPQLSTYFLHAGTAALFSQADTAVICPGSNVSFSVKESGAGFSYRWQVNNGNGYLDISDDAIYTGTGTVMLTLQSPPPGYYGNLYRCLSSNGTTFFYSTPQCLRFETVWNGSADNEFLNPANYNCNTAPGEYIDVVVPATAIRFPAVRYNSICRSLRIHPSATINIRPNVSVMITGH